MRKICIHSQRNVRKKASQEQIKTTPKKQRTPRFVTWRTICWGDRIEAPRRSNWRFRKRISPQAFSDAIATFWGPRNRVSSSCNRRWRSVWRSCHDFFGGFELGKEKKFKKKEGNIAGLCWLLFEDGRKSWERKRAEVQEGKEQMWFFWVSANG